MIFPNSEDLERAETYRLFAYLFMEIPQIEYIEEFENFAGISINDNYEEICDDFITLFIDGEVPNYEGYYLAEVYKNIPINFELRDVQHFYWTAGVAIDEELDLPPDHISMELLFMSYLIEQKLRDLQIDFLRRLCEWIPLFCDTLYEKAKTDFYKEVATSLKEFVLSECEG
ncbi:MAG: molecular chaperone TorD family protein [Thermodesulfovibrio sp.]|uniref:TorD/DmsD family molecular chaperone n=1 Tax=unclassified Thermodesulfovibrio TaxID=2645936 RepID=UPI00083B41A2|nr:MULTISPECIES: molecular chaperone TorD family protein [unclassified Thermodesulfovibrio]MDI1471707.1 molecular chaperone TorD family protein [Thermodesulfovibrio sp. 1176]MDI6713598.1 molecular chaperone TorD family protein [Thermodesulfovibrio sp.]ODA44045.1 Respiratory arsenate reductase cytoplasmic chaperone [Thermodesulfovibrio sp. N1]